MAEQREQIVFGVFKGMGDLLWATSAIRAELEHGSEVHLLLFPNPLLVELCSLIDLGSKREHLHFHLLPRGLPGLGNFISGLRALSPSVILISPHAPVADSSWRGPLALWLIKNLFWPSAVLVGASSERLAWLFDRRTDVDRTLPLSLREWTAYRLFRAPMHPPQTSPRPQFLLEIAALRSQAPVYDLLVDPGAGAKNRVWPTDKYPALLAALPIHWRVGFLGLPAELASLHSGPPSSRQVSYIPLPGSLRDSLATLSSAHVLLVMNSGTMHFAQILGIPAVAIFGQQDPCQVIEQGSVHPVYEQTVPCQPCGSATCSQPEVYCLTNLEPAVVARRLMNLRSASSPRPSGAERSVHIQIDGI